MTAAHLGLLFEADQAEDRSIIAGAPGYAALRERDARRRDEVKSILGQQRDLTAEQLFAAAWILNHGDTADEAKEAHKLASKAADQGYEQAKWLAAAALDRALMYSGQPQRYGTNIVPDGFGYRLWDVEPATTDKERARWNVPPLAEMHRRARELSAHSPQPNLDNAPNWLRNAIKRWREAGEQGLRAPSRRHALGARSAASLAASLAARIRSSSPVLICSRRSCRPRSNSASTRAAGSCCWIAAW